MEVKQYKEQGTLQKRITELQGKAQSTLKKSRSPRSGTEEEDEEEYKEDLFFVPKPKEQEPLKHIKLNVVLDDIWMRAHVCEKEGGVKRAKKSAFKGRPSF